MRLSIDRDRCQGHGRCYSAEPEVFEPIDDLGRADLIDGGLSTESLTMIQRLERVVAGCPERAISLELEEAQK